MNKKEITMATIKSYTDLEQSKKLAEILPLESADMCYLPTHIGDEHHFIASLSPYSMCTKMTEVSIEYCTPCWSLAALLDVLSEIKPQVYTPILFPSEGKWILQFAEYGHGNVCEVTCDNPVDACYEMILKLHELKML